MKNTRSYYTASGAVGKLSSGAFGFDIRNKKLYAGFGDTNREIILNSDTGWLSPVLENGWEKYDEDISFRIDSLGILHIKGTARYGALNYAIFQLPEAYRPTRNTSLVVLMREGHGRLDINTNGYVIPRGTEELVYDDDENPTGDIVEVGYLSLECGVML